MADPSEKMTGTDIMLVCPECGEQVQYHPEHDHYFCLFCRKYVKPTSKSAFESKKMIGVACPSCNEQTIRHPDHDHDFCMSCAKYVEPSPSSSDQSIGQLKQAGRPAFRRIGRWVKKNALTIILAILIIVIAAATISAIMLGTGLLSGIGNYSATAASVANVT